MSDIRVELLAVESCPHFESTRRALESVLREGIIETPIQVVFVGSQEDADFLEFPGSPTIRVNGRDVVPEPGLPVGLGCRIYRDAGGRVIDGPPIEAIRAVVQAHRRGRLEAFQRQEAGLVAEFARAAAEAEGQESAKASTNLETTAGGGASGVDHADSAGTADIPTGTDPSPDRHHPSGGATI